MVTWRCPIDGKAHRAVPSFFILPSFMKQSFLLLTLLCLLPNVAMADDSGECGDNLTWTYVESTKTLTIFGTGGMWNYSESPWKYNNINTLIIESGVTSIGSCALEGNSNLTSVTIPNSVTSIDYGAFWGCTGLAFVIMPNSVTSIGYKAFSQCYALTSITIPNSVTSIGEGAFQDCSGVTSVTIGNSVTSIGACAFQYCRSLTSVISLATTPPTCDNNVFDEVDKQACRLIVPPGSKEAYQNADGWKDFLTIEEDGETTSVATAKTGNRDMHSVYSIDGKRLNGMRKELNIIRMSDGTVRKVMVK
jgi:hypothetical protein